jgi:hypothetical protein
VVIKKREKKVKEKEQRKFSAGKAEPEAEDPTTVGQD